MTVQMRVDVNVCVEEKEEGNVKQCVKKERERERECELHVGERLLVDVDERLMMCVCKTENVNVCV